MKNKLKIILLTFCFISKISGQDCETLIEKFRKENSTLAKSENELSLSNAKLVNQLSAKQDSIILLTRKISTLERELATMRFKLENYKTELGNKNKEIGRLNERIRKLKEDLQKKIYTDQEVAAMFTDLRNSQDSLKKAEFNLAGSKKDNESLSLLITEKDNNLKLNDKVLETYASKSRDYIHFKEREIRFEDNLFRYEQILFALKFKEGDEEYIPTKIEKEKIERLVELVSRYDSKVKIQMIIGSKKDDKEFREKRENSVKRVFFSFPEPFNLNESNFSKRLKETTENYNVAILIVKK
jgi:DNA repair exonuclease SbcCD ATPase subunit